MKKNILLKFGELTLKSEKTRRKFLRKLVENLEEALKRKNLWDYFFIENLWDRILIRPYGEKEVPEDKWGELKALMARIPGVSWVEEVITEKDLGLEDIAKRGVEIYSERVRDKRFRVTVKRSGSHPYSSMDVEKTLGAELAKFGKVDLKNFDINVEIWIKDTYTYFILERIKAPGGLPVGTEGRGLVLVSGGFDSTVASFLLLKRGMCVDFLFYNLGGIRHLYFALKAIKHLYENWIFGHIPLFVEVDFRGVLKAIYESIPTQWYNLVLKRLMYIGAKSIAEELGIPVIATGESLGQVSSQTVESLVCTEYGLNIPIFRPLLTYDKEEIISLSRLLGTFPINSQIQEFCHLVPRAPVVHPSLDDFLEIFEKFPRHILTQAVENRKTFYLDKLELAPLEDIELSHLPEDGEMIEVPKNYRFQDYSYLDKNKRYIFVCDTGLRSFEVAYYLRLLGYTAYSLKGGLKRWRKTDTS